MSRILREKGERDLFDRNLKKAGKSDKKSMKFFDRISAGELMDLDLDDLIIECPILTLLQRSKCLKELHIIDALNHPEHILAALDGQHVGTIIYKAP